jgi:hypothetical protein
MKSAEYKKIVETIGKLSNNLVNLEIDYKRETKHWPRIGGLLNELEKDNEKLSKILRKASEQTAVEVERMRNKSRD